MEISPIRSAQGHLTQSSFLNRLSKKKYRNFFFLWVAAFLWSNTAHPAPVDVTWGRGLEFRKREDFPAEIQLRFRTQNLLELSSGLSGRESRILAQPRRLRLRFGGWIYDPRMSFNLQLSFTRGDMDWENTEFPNLVRDASVQFQLLPSLQLSFGQFKLPGNAQRVVSSGEMQFIDRSIVNRAFNIDRDFGFQMKLEPAQASTLHWRIKTALTKGGGRNSVARSAASNAVSARIELLPLGAFLSGGDSFEGDLQFHPEPKILFGWGAARFLRPDRTGGTIGPLVASSEADLSFATFHSDLLLKYRGLSIASEFILKRFLNESSTSQLEACSGCLPQSRYAPPLDGAGFNLQIGYLITEKWEPVLRYSALRPRSLFLSAYSETQDQLGFGINRYIQGHRIKVQSDLSVTRFSNSSLSQIQLQTVGRFQVELGI